MASLNNLVPLEATLNSTEVVQCMNKGYLIYDPLICECRSLLGVLGHPLINHIFREANKAANKLAAEAGKQLDEGINFLVVPPVFVNEALWATP